MDIYVRLFVNKLDQKNNNDDNIFIYCCILQIYDRKYLQVY